MDSNRLKRVEGQFRKDLADVFRELAQNRFKGVLISVTQVRITPDLSLARIAVSIFPASNKQEVLEYINKEKAFVKNALVQKLEGKLRKMPDLAFHLDESLDKEAEINRILKEGGESPIK